MHSGIFHTVLVRLPIRRAHGPRSWLAAPLDFIFVRFGHCSIRNR